MTLPDGLPTNVGQSQPLSDEAAAVEAKRIIRAALHEEPAPTSYRDDSPVPAIGSAPPVAQPGRPPMSQKATDASALMLSAGVASLPIGGMTSLVLYTLGRVEPVSLAIGAGAPVALALAIGTLLRRAKGVLPEEHHHHYTGPVHQDQRTVNSKTSGVWAKTRNEP